MAGYVLHLSEQENITLSAAVTRRLIDGGDGDAALLYLCLLKNRGQRLPRNAPRRAQMGRGAPLARRGRPCPHGTRQRPEAGGSALPPSPRPPPSAPPIHARTSPAS